MASPEDIGLLKATLEQVEVSLIRRIPFAAVRSPETLWEEFAMLDTVLELTMKLALLSAQART